MKRYNTFICDRILQTIQEAERIPVVKHLNQAEHFEQARLKLYEEINEYEEANIDEESLEELADILELVYTLGKMYGGSFEELNRIRDEKRGGFEKDTFLEEVLYHE